MLPEGFSAADMLRTSAVRQAVTGAPPYPTRAAYWHQRSPTRLRSARPLPGESVARAAVRARRARSYFARVTALARRVGPTEIMVTVTGTIVETLTGAGGRGDVQHREYAGSASSGWVSISADTPATDQVRSLYLTVLRHVIGRGTGKAPALPGVGATVTGAWTDYFARGQSGESVLIVDHADVQAR